MADEVISFFDCTAVPQEPQLVIPVQVSEEQGCVTVSSGVSDWSDLPDAAAGYKVVVSAARRFTRWITVTAEWFCRTVISRVRAFIRHTVRMTGVQILRQSAILRI